MVVTKDRPHGPGRSVPMFIVDECEDHLAIQAPQAHTNNYKIITHKYLGGSLGLEVWYETSDWEVVSSNTSIGWYLSRLFFSLLLFEKTDKWMKKRPGLAHILNLYVINVNHHMANESLNLFIVMAISHKVKTQIEIFKRSFGQNSLARSSSFVL